MLSTFGNTYVSFVQYIYSQLLTVHRVFNISGPQTVDQSILRKATSNTSPNTANTFPVLDDRISVTERILGINKPVPKDIYERLKIIEDKILYLEGISPEYKELWVYHISFAISICYYNREVTFCLYFYVLDLK